MLTVIVSCLVYCFALKKKKFLSCSFFKVIWLWINLEVCNVLRSALLYYFLSSVKPKELNIA